MSRIIRAIVAAGLLTVGLAAGLAALNPFSGWPTTCIELNDIVEGHLGNVGNVGIYPRVYPNPAHAEAACQADHEYEVRDAFGWAFSNPDPMRIVDAGSFGVGPECEGVGYIKNDLPDQICQSIGYGWWPAGWAMRVQWTWPDGTVSQVERLVPCTEPAYCPGGQATVVWTRGEQGVQRQPNGLLRAEVFVIDRETGEMLAGPRTSVIDIFPAPHGPLS